MAFPTGRLKTTVLAAAILLMAGCGVSFSDTFEGTELLKSMAVCDQSGTVCDGSSKEFAAGSPLTVDIAVTQGYPIPVRLACLYEDGDRLTDDQKKLNFEERAILAGETVLPPAADRRPDKKAPVQHLAFQFQVTDPGDYFLACLTPAAPDNGIGVKLRVR